MSMDMMAGANFEYLSRNRYFDLYSGEEGKKRLDSLRLIQSLHRDILQWGKNGLRINHRKNGKSIEIKLSGQKKNQSFERFTVLNLNEYRFLKAISTIKPYFEAAELTP